MKAAVAVLFILALYAPPADALKINDAAPTFALRDIRGGEFYLSDYVGPKKKKPVKGVILNFFATYCKPCRNELPVLNSLVDEYAKQGIVVVIVGFREDSDAISGLLSELRVDKPIILVDRYGKVGEKYGVRFLPMTLSLGADGRVQNIIRGEMQYIERSLRKLADAMLEP